MRLSATRVTAAAQGRGLGNQLWDLAGNRPSLDLRFAESKSLVDATTGTNLVDFTRAGSGRYVGSDGLIKTATTNLLLRSEEFDTTWNSYLLSSVNANTTVAPDGQTTADTVAYSANVFADINQGFSPVNGTNYTLSVWARSVSGTSAFRLKYWDGSTGNYSPAVPVTEAWERYSFTFTATSSSASSNVGFANATAAARSVVFWGAQLEQSSTVGEYIPTTSTINSAPRFDHDPTTGESLGLLVEEQRQNLLLRSEEFDDVAWSTSSLTITADDATAPDGTQTADKWLNTSTTGVISNSISKAASAITYTASLWVKSSDATSFSLTIDNGGTGDRGRCVFNITTGELVSTIDDGAFTGTSGTITAYPDSWYRLTVTTTTDTGTTLRWRAFSSGSGDIIYIWGAQLEEGSFPTSYIPTEGSTVTRAADVASISGSNFSSWMTSFGENTFFVEARNPRTDNGLFVEGGANAVQGISIGANNDADRVRVLVRHGPSRIDTGNSAGALFGDDNIKIAATTSADGSFVYVGGALQAQEGTPNQSDWSGLQLNIGSRYNGTLQSCCTISRITFWSQKLSETTLQGITQ